MATQRPLAVLLLLLLAACALPLARSRAAPRTAVGGGGGAAAADTIHELLRTHGLPGGLLPRGVESYSLDEANGLLEARLSAPCYAKYDDGDLAFFDTVVRGNLSFGALRGVEGLSQEELFVWLPVKGIVVADPGSGVILFDIGYAHKRLSRSLFEEPPDCKPSASAGTDAADAARWKDRQELESWNFYGFLELEACGGVILGGDVPGLRFMGEASSGAENHQDQR
uniref:Uncharacterized protein n=1 Tax=Oryza sativa subsp. japonica TaxID=39947 RepID=Q84ZC8_ORYSJ|nr:unknown protein [Oryza sativa Japonica Group]